MKHKIQITAFKNKVSKISVCITTAALTVQNVFCNSDISWITGGQEVNVDVGNLNGQVLVSRALTLILGLIALMGIFTTAQGFSLWSGGKSEDNSAQESKGLKKMLVGLVEIAAPAIFIWLLNAG